MSPPMRPKVRSRSSGELICRRDHAPGEARRIVIDRPDHQIGDLVAMIVPGGAVGKLRRHMLAEQARDMGALRRQRGIERRGDQHLDDRLAAPAMFAGVVIGAVHIGERRCDDDARGMMIADLAAGQAREGRQLGQRHIHAERAGAAFPAPDAGQEIGGQGAFGNQAAEQQLGIEIGDDGLGA